MSFKTLFKACPINEMLVGHICICFINAYPCEGDRLHKEGHREEQRVVRPHSEPINRVVQLGSTTIMSNATHLPPVQFFTSFPFE
jgi:hypothetical protein